jgi:hypothetical protein
MVQDHAVHKENDHDNIDTTDSPPMILEDVDKTLFKDNLFRDLDS